MTRTIPVALLLGLVLLRSALLGVESRDARIGTVPIPGVETASISWDRFDKIHAAVAPSGERERWTDIPWQTDLAMARREAAREKKPLLMWVMDGHPLGCT